MIAITDRQREVLAAIVNYAAVHGYPPTMRELADAIGVASTNCVSGHLLALENRGAIKRPPGRARAITVTPRGLAVLR